MRSANELRSAAQAYFDALDATRERFTLKNGEVGYRQVPYTMAGLYAAMGLTADSFTQIRKRRKGEARQERARREALDWAAMRVEQHVTERALLGELNASVAGVLIKGWVDEGGENKDEGGGLLQVVLEDPESLGE